MRKHAFWICIGCSKELKIKVLNIVRVRLMSPKFLFWYSMLFYTKDIAGQDFWYLLNAKTPELSSSIELPFRGRYYGIVLWPEIVGYAKF